jgi:tetratricopeptide (TPR) repeat protein
VNPLFSMLAAGWLSVQTPQFEVLTDTGDRTAREVLARLERMQAVFQDAQPAALPVRVYIFRSEREFAPFRPSESTTGFYQSGPERDIIAMQNTPDAGRIVFHEYVHLVLHHSTAKLPMWFEEGTAEFYSTLDIAGKKMRVGLPVAAHVRTLAEATWLSADELWAMNKASRDYNERSRVGIFYAQSWALVHMLNTAPAYRKHMQTFAGLLTEGVIPAAAFAQAFDVTLEKALADLRLAVEGKRFEWQELPWDGPSHGIPQQRSLSKAEADLKRGELFLALGRMEEAQTIYSKLSTAAHDTSAVETGLGAIAMSLSNYEVARQHLERAIELGSIDASTHFEYAMLLRESGAKRDRIEQALRRTLALNPRHVEANFILANMLATAGDAQQAILFLKKAIEILPRQSPFWYALALAYQDAGQSKDAQAAARRAANNAATPQEVDMAAGLQRMVNGERTK